MQQIKVNAIFKNAIQQELPQGSGQPSVVKDVEEEKEEEEEEEEEKKEVVHVNNSIVIAGSVTSPPRVSRFGFVKSPLTSIAPRE
jgi:hypothetical protein